MYPTVQMLAVPEIVGAYVLTVTFTS